MTCKEDSPWYVAVNAYSGNFFPVQEVIELQQLLQSCTQQLMRKEAELTAAEETIRSEQQQVRQLVHIEYSGGSRILPMAVLKVRATNLWRSALCVAGA